MYRLFTSLKISIENPNFYRYRYIRRFDYELQWKHGFHHCHVCHMMMVKKRIQFDHPRWGTMWIELDSTMKHGDMLIPPSKHGRFTKKHGDPMDKL